jgi:pimeloyl-ACP methyl ester carboxylesterase
VLTLAAQAHAGADRTTYPVVLAHGMAGFDNLVGLDYWGDDYGTFVGDPCDGFLEVSCNGDIDNGQKTFVSTVTPFHNSEVRGLELADDVEGFMASAGAPHVNLVGHSQGGLDIRKAAKVLHQRRGYTVAKVVISLSSPHRGSPVAQYILSLGPGVTSVIDALATYFGDLIYQPGNDGFAAAKQLVYGDISATDGITTGARNSLITAQSGLSVNPLLYLLSEFFFDIDGDGACSEDCDNDGAAGRGDGNRGNSDDDGLVGINSQQMGYRLRYDQYPLFFDQVFTDHDRGYVGNINAPSSTQMTSRSAIISQDHVDVIGIGPDTFDEMEFYAAIIDYIAEYD